MIKTIAAIGLIGLSLSTVAMIPAPIEDKQEESVQTVFESMTERDEESAAVEQEKIEKVEETTVEYVESSEELTETEQTVGKSPEEVFAEVEQRSGSSTENGKSPTIIIVDPDNYSDWIWSPLFKFG